MKTLLLIFTVLSFKLSTGQNISLLQKEANKLISKLKANGDYPLGGYDTLIDINGDHQKDLLIEYYGGSGTGIKNRVKVFLYSNGRFKEHLLLGDVSNPTFHFSKRLITGYYIALGGGYAVKLKWVGNRLDTLERIIVDVDNSIKDKPKFILASYNFATRKRKLLTLSTMNLPKEYNYGDYIPIIKKNGG